MVKIYSCLCVINYGANAFSFLVLVYKFLNFMGWILKEKFHPIILGFFLGLSALLILRGSLTFPFLFLGVLLSVACKVVSALVEMSEVLA